MNENINLCEILKGHEGEKFYNPTFGYCELNYIKKDVIFGEIINFSTSDIRFFVNSKGFSNPEGECCIFPSKNQRSWKKWIEEQKPKFCKTWEELSKHNKFRLAHCQISRRSIGDFSEAMAYAGDTAVEKSALALLKIHQVINSGYGGNVTNEYFENNTTYSIVYCEGKFEVYQEADVYEHSPHVVFHNQEQAEEFLTYPENIKLLKDYWMIKDKY